jgi:quinolinate synthase
LANLARVLELGNNEIHVDPAIRKKALIPLERMVNFAAQTQVA